MSKSLAMRTYEAMGAEKFKDFVIGMDEEQFDYLFGMCEIVDPFEQFDDRQTYIEIIFDYPEKVNVVNMCMVEDASLFMICRDRAHGEAGNTVVLKMGRKAPNVKDIAWLGVGSKYEVYDEDLILEGVGVKVGSNGWQETGTVGYLDNCEVAEYLGQDHIKFYDEDGERIFQWATLLRHF